MGQELTTANKILVTAAQMAETQETFTAEDLIVHAWQHFPESFGLSGYREQYPDSNRVLSKLMGSVGLCSRGWLEQVSTKTYRMTAAGRKLATALRSNGDAAAIADARAAVVTPARSEPRATEKAETSKPRVRQPDESRAAPAVKSVERPAAAAPRVAASGAIAPTSAKTPERPAAPVAAVRAAVTPARPAPAAPVVPTKAGAATSASTFEGLHVLQRLATSVAIQKFSRGGLVTFQDACQFWAITPSIQPAHLQPRLNEIEALLKRAEQLVQQTNASIRVNDRLEITMTTVVGLQGVHRMLAQRYHRELENIRGRAASHDADN